MTLSESNQIKGIAILLMLLLHLFNTYDYQNIYDPYILINGTPLTFYISLFADCCVVLFLFCSGYGLYFSYKKKGGAELYFKSFPRRLKSLYLKYWIILILFCFILGPLLGETPYPGTLQTILLNLTAIDTSYNGAWWFFTTYVLCLLLSPILFKYNTVSVIFIFFVIYTIGYIQRFKSIIEVSNPIMNWAITEVALLGNSLLPFLLGAYFVKLNLLNHLRKLSVCQINWFAKNTILYFFLLTMFILKTYVPSLFVAIFTGVGLIICYLLIDKPLIIESFFSYLGHHSSNIWLSHMFLYVSFETLSRYVYLTNDPVIIFCSLLIMSILFSYLINGIESFINKQLIKVKF